MLLDTSGIHELDLKKEITHFEATPPSIPYLASSGPLWVSA